MNTQLSFLNLRITCFQMSSFEKLFFVGKKKNNCFLSQPENLFFILDKKQMKKHKFVFWKLFKNTIKHLHLERQTI